MNLSRKVSPDSTKVPDDILALSRKRIAANRPETDKLLAYIKNGATWEAIAKARQEALVNFVATYKTVSIAIHDILCHKAPFSVCLNPLCQTNNEQIDAGIGLIARSSELEPKEGVES